MWKICCAVRVGWVKKFIRRRRISLVHFYFVVVVVFAFFRFDCVSSWQRDQNRFRLPQCDQGQMFDSIATSIDSMAWRHVTRHTVALLLPALFRPERRNAHDKDEKHVLRAELKALNVCECASRRVCFNLTTLSQRRFNGSFFGRNENR